MVRRIIFLMFSLWLCLGATQALAQEGRRDPFYADFSDEVRTVVPGEVLEFKVDFKIPDKYYLYDDKTSVLLQNKADFEQIQSKRPLAEDHFDPFFKKNIKVHFKDFSNTIYLKVPPNAKPGRRTLEAELRYQGCSDDFCYRPIKKTILLPVEVRGRLAKIAKMPPAELPKVQGPAKASSPEKSESILSLITETNPEKLLNLGKVPLLGLAVLGGILTSFTPCVLPIIPLTLAFIGVRQRKKGNLLRALLLVVGMVTMYASLGFFVAALGLKLGFLFQSRYFVLMTAIFFLIFALGLFGLIPFHLPPRLHQKFTQMGGEGPFGAFVAGLTIGLIASPCVGPLIAPLLLIAARMQDRLYGFLLLLSYGIGMGLIFLVLATGWAELQTKLKGGRWTYVLKKAMAVLMLLPALYYGQAFAKPFLGHSVDSLWVTQFEIGMKQAKSTGKPVLLDFYADWCPPCVELDKLTFSKPEVRALAKEFVMLKIDCSFNDKNCEKATENYEVIGWPTVLFLYPDGSIIPKVHLVGGFANQEKMLHLMRQALEKSKQFTH